MEHPLVAIHHQLVGAADEVDLVVAAEVLAHIPTKQVARTSGAQPPPLNVLCTAQQVGDPGMTVCELQGGKHFQHTWSKK